ncbi:MAG: hypothetical protein H7Y11_13455, partial [Armatimonadetes bacterium]|nr:hypothetical protein [Anaerolineae bacterium]
AVFVFKKRADYSPENARAILYSVPLTRVDDYGRTYSDPTLIGPVPWNVERADVAPTQLMLTDDMQEIQYSGGTWSERFDRTSIINTQPLLTVAAWWLSIMAFGWAAFPLLFVLAPGLADRGYALAKFAGILLVAWVGWFAASARVPLWSPEGLRAIWVGLALISLVVAIRNRVTLLAFIRARWRLLLAIEGLTLLLFLVWVGVRLTNPDLWTTGFGGEKPMDYAYFNGVLRSTIFPPIDPWYADGYLNYYYFGFVIVGAPTLFTGVLPATAYNLIVPTLYALTGIGAFAVAFSIISAVATSIRNGKRRLPSPYMAGMMALLLAVVFGNLDTPRTFFTGLARAGGYQELQDTSQWLLDDFKQQNGRDPNETELQTLYAESTDPSFSTQVRYELTIAGNIVGSIGRGMGKLVAGEQIYINPDRWFWGPSRVVGEPLGDSSITEMPIFTYVYGDLHAHMIAMPLILLIVCLLYNEVALAGREQRGAAGRGLALSLIALAVGLTIATNSWDYPTFMVFGALGLGYAWWLNWRRLSRASV